MKISMDFWLLSEQKMMQNESASKMQAVGISFRNNPLKGSYCGKSINCSQGQPNYSAQTLE